MTQDGCFQDSIDGSKSVRIFFSRFRLLEMHPKYKIFIPGTGVLCQRDEDAFCVVQNTDRGGGGAHSRRGVVRFKFWRKKIKLEHKTPITSCLLNRGKKTRRTEDEDAPKKKKKKKNLRKTSSGENTS